MASVTEQSEAGAFSCRIANVQATWADAKTFITERLKADGESSIDFSSTTFEGIFDKRCQLALALFSKATLWLYTSKAALTLAANDQDLAMNDPAKCAKPVFAPRKVWIASSPIQRFSSLHTLNENWDAVTTSASSPVAWAELNDYTLRFNCPCSSGLTGTYVAGFYSHPKPAADDATLELPLDHMDLLGAFTAVALRSKVWSETLTLERLKGYSKEAATGITAIRNKQLARHYQSE